MADDLPKNPAVAARLVMRRTNKAVLATLGQARARAEAGWPRASLITVALATDGCPILLLSDLALHARNLKGDDRASLLFDATQHHANPQEGSRVSVMGRIRRTDDKDLGRRFLARHPGARLYQGFGDFSFYRMEVARAHYVGGFGVAVWVRRDELLIPGAPSRALARAEAAILERVNNRDADGLRIIANGLLRARGKHWRLIAADPEGGDMRCGNTVHRIRFAKPVADAPRWHRALGRLRLKARAGG